MDGLDPSTMWRRKFGALSYIAGLNCEELIADGTGRFLLLLPCGESRQARDRRILAASARILLAVTPVDKVLTER